MIIETLLLCLVLLICPYFPWILTPTSYAIGGTLLVQNINLRLLSAIYIIFATSSVIMLRFIEWYIIKKIEIYQEKVHHKDFLSRRWKKIKIYMENMKNGHKTWTNFKKQLASEQGQRTLFILAIVGFMPTIPDAVTVALLQKRLKFWYFVLAAIIWKCIQFLPFVFLGKWILIYFKL